MPSNVEKFSQAVLKDRAFYLFVILYGAAAFSASIALNEPRWFQPFCYFGILSSGASLVGLIALARHTISGKQRIAPETWSGILLFIWIGAFLGIFTSMKTMMPNFSPFQYDPLLADIDELLHGKDPWLWLTWLNPVTSQINFLYSAIWASILAGLTLWICLSRAGFRTQYIWTLFTCWIGLGNLIPMLSMAGGPVFYDRLVVGSDRFSGLMAHLNETGGTAAQFPATLWDAYVNRIPGAGLGISAFPSLHVSMATLFMLTGFKMHCRVGYLLALYLVFVQIASVHLGWHYAIDGYFSIIATTAVWKLFERKSFFIQRIMAPYSV